MRGRLFVWVAVAATLVSQGVASHSSPAARTALAPAAGWSLSAVSAAERTITSADLTARASGAGRIATWQVSLPAGRWFLRGTATGTRGRAFIVRSGSASSAPVHVDAIAQRFGFSFTSTGAPVRLDVVAKDAWSAGDTLLLTDVAVVAASASTSTVRPGTRVVEVNGSAFTMQGYTYVQNQPIGEHFITNSWATDATACQNDARLLGAAGVTALRVWFEPYGPAIASAYKTCMDAFWANGIGMLWLILAPTAAELPAHAADTTDPVWAPVWEQWIQTMLDTVGSHPASLFWEVGNEVELSGEPALTAWYGNRASGKVGLLNRLAQYIHAHDPNHLVSTATAHAGTHLQTLNVPDLDLWGIHPYAESRFPSPGYYASLSTADPRPKYLGEFGVDRYSCNGGARIPNADPAAWPNFIAVSCATGSGENQAAQSDWDATSWDNLAPHIAGDAQPQGHVFGGQIFMYADNWSYSIGALTPLSTVVHDTYGRGGWAAPDNTENPEWWGVNHAVPHAWPELRPTGLAFDALAERWTGLPAPSVSGLTVTPLPNGDGTCALRVEWTTATPATSELLLGRDLQVLREGADTVADNTILTIVAVDPALTTSHSITYTAAPSVSGELLVIQPRGFTADGRTGVAAPVRNHYYC